VADAPWRCSQCGTINEPVANACRTCGRWPSLFDLEETKVEDFPASVAVADDDDEVADLETAAQEPDFAPEPEEPLPPEVIDEAPVAQEARTRRRRRQQLVRFAIPVGIALYILISSIANR
jgi:hypothetical protein